MSLATRRELVRVIRERYIGSTQPERARILDEFVAATGYHRKHAIRVLTRSRPYRKNDQAWVEQKNGAVVRRLVGYDRLEGLKAAEALTRLYASSRLFVNFFQPCFKLASKTRVGARVEKRYHPPATPCARLLALDGVPEAIKEQLRAVAATLDPVRLLDEIRATQQHIAKIAAGEPSEVIPSSGVALAAFLEGLATAWRDGEVRPTHRPPTANFQTEATLAYAHRPIPGGLAARPRVAGRRT